MVTSPPDVPPRQRREQASHGRAIHHEKRERDACQSIDERTPPRCSMITH
jgi:hypothetical protein